jgi:hypothetical protein
MPSDLLSDSYWDLSGLSDPSVSPSSVANVGAVAVATAVAATTSITAGGIEIDDGIGIILSWGDHYVTEGSLPDWDAADYCYRLAAAGTSGNTCTWQVRHEVDCEHHFVKAVGTVHGKIRYASTWSSQGNQQDSDTCVPDACDGYTTVAPRGSNAPGRDLAYSGCNGPGTGGGGDNLPPADYGCHWERSFWALVDSNTYEVVAWGWSDEWHQVCGGETAPAPTEQTKRNSVNVTLLATGHLMNNRRTTVMRDPATGSVVVALDTTVASAADLALALKGAERIQSFVEADSGKSAGVVTGKLSRSIRAQFGKDSQADAYLKRLLKSDQRTVMAFGRGRALDITLRGNR